MSAFKIHRALFHMKSAIEDGIIELFLDNGNYANYTGNVNNGLEFGNVYLTVGEGHKNNPLISNVIISNAPVRLYEEVSTLVYPETFTFDIVRDTLGIWRYENYGTAELLTVVGTTVTDLPIEKSKTGSAFYQTNYARCFDTPPADEVWIKFDVYIESNDYSEGFLVGNVTKNKDCYWYVYGNKYIRAYSNFGYVTTVPYKTNLSGTLTTCIVHLKAGITDGLMEFWINGEKVNSCVGGVNNGKAFDKLFIQKELSPFEVEFLFSKVVISNAPLYFDDDYRHGIFFDLICNVITKLEEKIDINRSISHFLKVSAMHEEDTLPDTFGVENIEVRIAEQQLTDQVNFTLANYDAEILEQFQGIYLDYEFDLRIEELTERGILTTCHCRNNNDLLLYTPLSYDMIKSVVGDNRYDAMVDKFKDGDLNAILNDAISQSWLDFWEIDAPIEGDYKPELYFKASLYVKKIAQILGKEAVCQFYDFATTMDTKSEGQTFEDIISELFGWTSRIPTLTVNCYIRADKFFVVQRGYEKNTINLNDLEIGSKPTKHKKILRMFWGTTKHAEAWTETVTNKGNIKRRLVGNPILAPYPTNSKNGKSNYTRNSDGLVSHTVTWTDTTRTETDYEYITLSNGRKVLHLETTQVYDKSGIRIDYKQTYHNYLEQGQSHIVVTDEEGDEIGSVVGNSKADDRITPFTAYTFVNGQKQAVLGIEYKWIEEEQKEHLIGGISLVNNDFPVHSEAIKQLIVDEIHRINLKTEEEITMDIYNFNHIIDFNDNFLFNGNQYWLKSNTAIKNSRIVNKQTITIVRWY